MMGETVDGTPRAEDADTPIDPRSVVPRVAGVRGILIESEGVLRGALRRSKSISDRWSIRDRVQYRRALLLHRVRRMEFESGDS